MIYSNQKYYMFDIMSILWYNSIIYNKGGVIMKTNTSDVSQKARKLVMLAKEKGLIKSHTVAFKDFPVEKEIHKGKLENCK